MVSKAERAELQISHETDAAWRDTTRRVDEVLATMSLTEIQQLVDEIEAVLGGKEWSL